MTALRGLRVAARLLPFSRTSPGLMPLVVGILFIAAVVAPESPLKVEGATSVYALFDEGLAYVEQRMKALVAEETYTP